MTAPGGIGDSRWVREVRAPDGRSYEVVAVRRGDALHEPDTSTTPGNEAAAAAAALVVEAVRSWRRRGRTGWTVAVLTRRRLLGQRVVLREALPVEADPVGRAEAVVEEIRSGRRRL